jgi:uncharacterized protein DUF839
MSRTHRHVDRREFLRETIATAAAVPALTGLSILGVNGRVSAKRGRGWIRPAGAGKGSSRRRRAYRPARGIRVSIVQPGRRNDVGRQPGAARTRRHSTPISRMTCEAAAARPRSSSIRSRGNWSGISSASAGRPSIVPAVSRHARLRQHGYCFDVPAAANGQVAAVAIPDMGRFAHEALAVDPNTWIVYETEDNSGNSGFYRFIPDTPGVPGPDDALSSGGLILRNAR